MKLTAQLTALSEETRGLTPVERARRCCDLAKQLEKAGEYEAACEALNEFWPDRNGPLNLNDLDKAARAEMLLRIGTLSGWLGSTDQAAGSQETAKNLITRKPIVVKIAPDVTPAELEQIVSTCESNQVAGIIAANTTIEHSPISAEQDEEGGLSGAPRTARGPSGAR